MSLEDIGMKVLIGADPATATAPVPAPAPAPKPISEGAETIKTVAGIVYKIAAAASSGASFYHGLKKNDSLGWGLWWGFCGGLFPILTPLYAYHQDPVPLSTLMRTVRGG